MIPGNAFFKTWKIQSTSDSFNPLLFCHQLSLGPTVFRGSRNFEQSRGICPFSVEFWYFRGISRNYAKDWKMADDQYNRRLPNVTKQTNIIGLVSLNKLIKRIKVQTELLKTVRLNSRFLGPNGQSLGARWSVSEAGQSISRTGWLVSSIDVKNIHLQMKKKTSKNMFLYFYKNIYRTTKHSWDNSRKFLCISSNIEYVLLTILLICWSDNKKGSNKTPRSIRDSTCSNGTPSMYVKLLWGSFLVPPFSVV